MTELIIQDPIVENAISSQQDAFVKMAGGLVTFQKEAYFARQVLLKNTYTMKLAASNPESLMSAVMNIAAVGLTLNPAQKYAYLIPRDGQICLDISYIGLLKLATDCGSIKWAQAELVHGTDSFKYMGPGQKANHEFNPFGERGSVIGVYCTAKTSDGDYLTTVMSISDCHKIRDKSSAWTSKKSGPWKTDEGEMMKKTVIKRASKTWPKTEKAERLQTAIDVLNTYGEGSNFEEEKITENQTLILQSHVTKIENGEARLIKHLSAKYSREIKTCDELSKSEADYSIRFLEQYLD